MLGDYKVSRCTRRCCVLDRPLRDGEWYYSVVSESDDQLVRTDYSAEAWTEPPADAIGWWKNRIPTADEKKMVLAPPPVLIDLLRKLESFPDRQKTRYLLALMLMRKKIVRPCFDRDDEGESNQDSNETMRVQVVADGSSIDVAIVEISRNETENLTEQLNELLYCEAEPEMDED